MATLNWIGKEAVINHDKEVPFRLLKKVKTASAGTSKNLIVHGDNLEALKALMPHYQGKVKCIYIDPPYNTGNEGWIYNDKVNSPKIRQWLGKVVGGQSADLNRHDKWLCMMYPRLKLLREFLSPEGVIFISIDDNELGNLRSLMDEIYGEENQIGILTWYKKRKGSFLSRTLVSLTEYILVYKNTRKAVPLFGGVPDQSGSQPLVKRTNSLKELQFPADFVTTRLLDGLYKKGIYGKGTSSVKLFNDVRIKNGKIKEAFVLKGPFIWSQNMLDEQISLGASITINTNNFQPRAVKIFSEQDHKGLPSYIDGRQFSATNDDAYEELRNLFGVESIFNYSKPKNLLTYLIQAATFSDKEAIVLDSFAGSGTTGHAVLELNKQDGGNRKFILVEMEEHAKTVTAERIRRAIKKYNYNDSFEYCELDRPLFNEGGQIEETCDFKQFATYIYFTETQTNIDPAKISGNYIGENGSVEYYLIYKEPHKNDLDKSFLKKLSKTDAKKIVYADRCTLDEADLAKYNLVFKQIPYEVKVF